MSFHRGPSFANDAQRESVHFLRDNRTVASMRAHECHHCKQWIEEGAAHDCWTTTEAALTDDLSDDLKEAWERLREEAAALGEQRIYASGTAIMFARTACYCFVRPKRSFLQLVIFLGRTIRAPQVRRVERTSKAKQAHFVQIRHRDEVESPVTEWLREAYEQSEALTSAARRPARARARAGARRVAKS
jgi:hypothetical protein